MVTLLLSVALAASPLPADPSEFLKLAPPERQKLLVKMSRQELSALYSSMDTAQLLAVGRQAAKELGAYSARVVKRERVDGELIQPQTIDIVIRESPPAVRASYVAGPAKGRKVLYDSTVKKDQMRAKEAGLLGIAGHVWVGVNSSLARGDSNHPITDFGFTPIVRLLEETFAGAKPLGGFARTNDGFDEKGHFCHTFTGPKGGEKLYATKARICFDTVLAVPVVLEIDDTKGPLERYYFSDVKQLSKPDFSL